VHQEHSDDFAATVAHIARELLAQRSVREALDRITQLAVEIVDGCDHAGILVVQRGGKVKTATATSQLVFDSDKAQGELGEGPCFDAARSEQSYRVVDMRTEQRWPRFAPKALELGIGSMMGFQLFADEEKLGALDLYSEHPYGLTVESERKAWIFASHAGVALAGVRHGKREEQDIL
jgi:transcriptional regulator with GAF, ATPase, and Fis domain